jgi:EAL domain-containing protein (putative c-di-GMP-specific phosphodiesterase class I)
VARLGGDEFTVILPELSNKTDIEALTSTILSKLAEPFLLTQHHTSAYISASIGITLYPEDGVDANQLMGNVDQAMYEAKSLGRNGYSFFVPALRERVTYKSALLADLRGALSDQQLSLNFQPIIDLSTQRIVKLEVLLRWNHPKRGAVSPAEFIPLAEESGLIVEIGAWVFRQAAHWIKRWTQMGFTELQVGVNMSPVQLQGAMTSIDPYFDALQEFAISGENVIIEITEGVLLHAGNDSKNMLRRFREAGCKLAIDDFGTGYSALSYLKQFDVDYLKIDQSFVRDLVNDPSDMALTEAIIVMAHKLGLKVIAEGVETSEQKQLLMSAGCDLAQGYLFSKPVTAAIAEQLLLGNIGYGDAE